MEHGLVANFVFDGHDEDFRLVTLTTSRRHTFTLLVVLLAVHRVLTISRRLSYERAGFTLTSVSPSGHPRQLNPTLALNCESGKESASVIDSFGVIPESRLFQASTTIISNSLEDARIFNRTP